MSSLSTVKVPEVGKSVVESTTISSGLGTPVPVIAPSSKVRLGQLAKSCIRVEDNGTPFVKAQYWGLS